MTVLLYMPAASHALWHSISDLFKLASCFACACIEVLKTIRLIGAGMEQPLQMRQKPIILKENPVFGSFVPLKACPWFDEEQESIQGRNEAQKVLHSLPSQELAFLSCRLP